MDADDLGWLVEVETPDGLEPVWDLGRVAELLDRHRAGRLFMAGCVADQRALYDRFDVVVLLSAPVDLLLARVAARADPFGSTARDRDRDARDLAAYEPLLRAGADHEVVTTVPVAEVVEALERSPLTLGEPSRRSSGSRSRACRW